MNISDRVKAILGAVPATRNDDKLFIIIYMQKSGVDLSDKQIAKIKAMPSFESLRRTRQKYQELGQYRADPKVEEARYERYKQVRQDIPFMGPDQVATSVDKNGIKRDSDGYPIY